MPAKLQKISYFAVICLIVGAVWWVIRQNSPRNADDIDALKSRERDALSRGDALAWRHPPITDGD